MPKRISTVRGREFGDGVRAMMRTAGLTTREVCQMLAWDKAKLSDLINGKRGSSEVELGVLLGVCRTPPAERDHLLTLFQDTHLRGWYQQHGACQPIMPRTLVEHERKAVKLISWQLALVHGLLQIPEYMRAVIAASATSPAREIEARIAARVERQKIFRSGRLEMATFYIHEPLLHVPIGGPDVMSEQLHHLLRMSVRPYISLRVVPTATGAHAGLAGSFDLMRFDKHEPAVFLDSENSNLIIESPDAVKGYQQVIASLERQALDEEQSRRLITDLVT